MNSSRASPMDHSVDHARFSDIDSENRAFQITTPQENTPLQQSIQDIGLISPPILHQNANRLQIISGFRRIHACRKLGWSNIESRILPSETRPLRLVQIAIADNAFQRELNLIELSRAYRLLSNLMPDVKELGRTASALHLPGTPAYIEKLLPLGRFPEILQQGILSDTLSLPMAIELAELGDETGFELATLFHELRPSVSKQREILGTAKEIAARDDLTVVEVFQAAPMQDIRKNVDTDRNQKIHQIRSYLKRLRFPTLSRSEEKFRELVKKLKLGPDVQLSPPPFFEGSVFSLHLRFSRLSELKAGAQAMDRILQSPDIQQYIP